MTACPRLLLLLGAAAVATAATRAIDESRVELAVRESEPLPLALHPHCAHAMRLQTLKRAFLSVG